MGAYAGPEIKEDGLVLAFDAGNTKNLPDDRTENLLKYSEELDNSLWAVSEYGTIATVTSNNITAPDGSTTADRINFAPDVTGQSRRTQSIAFSNTTYTVSAYVKKGDRSTVNLYVTASAAPYPNMTYNFDTDTITTASSSATRTLLPDGWVRISCTATVNADTGAHVGFIGNTTGYTYAWGLQCERKNGPFDYYPTTTTTKSAGTTWKNTIGSDTGTLTNAPVYGFDNGGYFSLNGVDQYITLPEINTAGNEITFSVWNYGTIAKQSSIFYIDDLTSTRVLNVNLPWSDGTVYFDKGGGGSYDRTTKSATATEYQGWHNWVFTANAATGSMKIYLDGALWHSDTGKNLALTDATGTGRFVGRNGAGTGYHQGYISNLKLYTRELSASEIQQDFNALRGRFGI